MEHSIIRFGRYARSTPQPRQRFQCRRTELDENGQPVLAGRGRPKLVKHVFTPHLPHAHVHPAEGGCAECEELRGHHHGETAVARRHAWPTRIVARGLLELSLGGSFADASRWALRMAQADADRFAELVADGMSEADAAGWVEAEAADAAAEAVAPAPSQAAPRPLGRPARVRVRARRPRKSRAKKPATTAAPSATGDEPAADAGEPKAKTKNSRTADSTNVWHVAADGCEAFASVVFEDVERRLGGAALPLRLTHLGEMAFLAHHQQPVDCGQHLIGRSTTQRCRPCGGAPYRPPCDVWDGQRARSRGLCAASGRDLASRASSDEPAPFLGSTSHGRGDAEGAVPPDRGETMHSTVRSFRTAGGVTLGVEHFGDAAAPLVLLAGGPTLLSWPDALCETLARGGRHVVRYDLRDAGASTTVDPVAPAYTLRDLATDAAALARGLDDRPAHLAGIGVGGMVVQVAALDHPGAFSTLTLAGTRPVAPGRVDDDLPDHDAATMKRRFALPMPDWSDRAAVAEFAAARAVILGDDPAAARATAERIFDRTPGTEPAVQMANQMGMVFSKLNCEPRWRERLPELAIPALVVHGRRDTFFPVGNGEALAREIPGARLLVLEQAATALPDAAADEVAAAMLAL